MAKLGPTKVYGSIDVTGIASLKDVSVESLVVSGVSTRLVIEETDYATGNSGIEWTTSAAQNAELIHEITDGDIYGSGQALILRSSGSTAATVNLQVEGEIYATGQRVFHDTYHPNADKWTTARTLTLTGDVSGSVSWDGSANASLSVTVANGSHTHDDRYYTETESDARFLGISAKAADAQLLDGINSTSFLRSDATDTFTNLSGTSITLGSGVKLGEASHRPDLLVVESQTSGWAGICIDNTASETVWSLMADGTTCGLYDDTSNVWLWQATDSAGIRLYYNSSTKLETTTSGVTVTGTVTAGTFSGALSGNATTATWADTVDVNGSNTSATWYDIVWHSGDTLYSSTNVEIQGSTGSIRANAFVGNASSATKWATARTITLGGDASGSVSIDGSANQTLTVTVANDSHTHDTRYTQISEFATAQTFADIAGKYLGKVTSSGVLEVGRYIDFHTTNSTADNDIRLDCSSSSLLSMTGGDFTCSGNVTAYSDIRLKTNIAKIDNALDKVNQLNGYTFDRTDVECPRQTGVIAQEVQEVLPEAIVHGEEHMSVAYGNMVGLLIEAIKEQQQQIDELKKPWWKRLFK
ncbi:long tail fiber protein distal subunit [Vibrio phage K567]